MATIPTTTPRETPVTSPNLDIKAIERAAGKTRSAARRHYLEQWADPVVTANHLRIAIVLLTLLLAFLGAALMFVSHGYKNLKPLVIRIDSVGHAQAVNYDAATYVPQEPEMRYFLNQWVELYYSRNRYTLTNDVTKSLAFLDAPLARNVMAMHRQAHDLDNFLANPNAPTTSIRVNQITLDQINKPPYKATIDFTATQIPPFQSTPISQQRYTVTVQFVFRDHVPNDMIPINPLGFSIIYFHDQQAFVN